MMLPTRSRSSSRCPATALLALVLLLCLSRTEAKRVVASSTTRDYSSRKLAASSAKARRHRLRETSITTLSHGGGKASSSKKSKKSAEPSASPSISPRPSTSPAPSNTPTRSLAPSERPTDAPSNTPTRSPAPSARPTDAPTMSPTTGAPTASPTTGTPTVSPAPTLSFAPTPAARFTQDVRVTLQGDVERYSQCEREQQPLPKDASNVVSQPLYFQYTLHVKQGADPAQATSVLETRLHQALSFATLDCEYGKSEAFHVQSLSSLPVDRALGPCEDDVMAPENSECWVVQAGTTPGLFYRNVRRRGRNLQTIADPNVLEEFGSLLERLYNSKRLILEDDEDIVGLRFNGFTNGLQTQTYEPPGKNNRGGSQVSAVGRGEQPADQGNRQVVWGGIVVGVAVVALVIVASVFWKRRSRYYKSREDDGVSLILDETSSDRSYLNASFESRGTVPKDEVYVLSDLELMEERLYGGQGFDVDPQWKPNESYSSRSSHMDLPVFVSTELQETLRQQGLVATHKPPTPQSSPQKLRSSMRGLRPHKSPRLSDRSYLSSDTVDL